MQRSKAGDETASIRIAKQLCNYNTEQAQAAVDGASAHDSNISEFLDNFSWELFDIAFDITLLRLDDSIQADERLELNGRRYDSMQYDSMQDTSPVRDEGYELTSSFSNI